MTRFHAGMLLNAVYIHTARHLLVKYSNKKISKVSAMDVIAILGTKPAKLPVLQVSGHSS